MIASRGDRTPEGLDIDSAELVSALWRFAKGAEEGRYPAGVGVRALSELARLSGLYRTIDTPGGEGSGDVFDRWGGRDVKILEYQRTGPVRSPGGGHIRPDTARRRRSQ